MGISRNRGHNTPAHRLIPQRIYFYGRVLDNRITTGAAMPARADGIVIYTSGLQRREGSDLGARDRW